MYVVEEAALLLNFTITTNITRLQLEYYKYME